MTLLTRLQLTLALLVFAVLPAGCALFGLPVQLAVIGAVAVLSVWWAGVSVGEVILRICRLILRITFNRLTFTRYRAIMVATTRTEEMTMKTDRNGCSTCPRGSEQYEEYYDRIMRGKRVQYDYRTPEGKLFSCIAKTLEEARRRRDAWLEKQVA